MNAFTRQPFICRQPAHPRRPMYLSGLSGIRLLITGLLIFLVLGTGLEKSALADPILLVTNKHEDTLAFVDPDSYEVIEKIPVGHNPHEMATTPDGRYLYMSNYDPPGNTASVVDLFHRCLIRQIDTEPYHRIHSAAVSPDGKHVYFTAGQTGYVVEVDTQRNEVARGIPTHGKISHMVEVSPDGKRLYTANIETRNVSVIDRKSGELITLIPCDAGCEGIRFTPDGKHLWAANQNAGNITVIRVADHKVADTIECSGMPLRIVFTEDGSRAFVSNWLEKGEVVVIDVAAGREIKRIPVGNQPIGLLLTPDQKRLFVTNMTSNDIHVIDTDSLEIAKRFETGLGPDAMIWWVPPEGAEKAPEYKTISLLKENNRDRLYTYLRGHGRDKDPADVFTWQDGQLRISGEIWGGLVSRDEYKDYHLILEYKWGEETFAPRKEAARDSGLILHSYGEDGAYNDTWMQGIEVQMIEGGTGDFILIGDGSTKPRVIASAEQREGGTYYEPGAKPVERNGQGRIFWSDRAPDWKDEKGFRGPKDVEKPIGQWNRLECHAVGDTITVKLNDQIINRCYGIQPRHGKIQVQSEAAEVFIRRMDLILLNEQPAPQKQETATRQ